MTFLLSDFLSGDFDSHLQTAVKSIQSFPANFTHCLLCGPSRSGKTSVLIQYAYKAAMKGQQVVIICQQDRIEQTCPTLPQGVDKASPIWRRIHMRYLKTSQDLQKYAACLHLGQMPPAVVIVDDLSSFLQSRPTDKRANESELIKTLAMLHEATVSLDRLSDHKCLLLVCDEGGPDGPRSLFIYERWCPLVLTIQPSAHSKLVLSALPATAEKHFMHPSCLSRLHFSLTNNSALTLESVTQPTV